MKFALVATFFGPFIGVSLSLMAVEYANAGIASTLMGVALPFCTKVIRRFCIHYICTILYNVYSIFHISQYK